jgi:hypothetical protein
MWLLSDGSCPNDTYDSKVNDNITPGGPYRQCICK